MEKKSRKSLDYNVYDLNADEPVDESTNIEEISEKKAKAKKSKSSKKHPKTFKEKFFAFFDSLSVSQVLIGALSAAIVVVAVATLVVIFRTNAKNDKNENLAKQVTSGVEDATSGAEEVEEPDSGVETANVEVVEPVSIPDMSEYTIKSQSTVKDLTLIFQGSDKKNIKGTEFAVKLVDEASAKKLNSSIDTLKKDKETLNSLKTKQDEIKSQMTSANASTVVSDVKTKTAKNNASSASVKENASGSSSDDSLSKQMQDVNDEVTKAIEKRDSDIKAYNKTLDGLKGNTYKDDDKDGMIYIKSIDAGNYVACAESVGNFTASSYTTKVAVKEKADYKPIKEIKEKVVSDKVAGDTKEEKPAVESTLKDTVEYVDSTKSGDGGNVETTDIKLPEPAASKELNSQTVKDNSTTVATTITLSPTSLNMKVGESSKITATVNTSGTTVSWITSDESVATVDANGNVTAVKAGTATITATAGSATATCAVTVTAAEQAVTVKSVSISGNPSTLTVGEIAQLSATVTYSDSKTDSEVTWSSSNTDVATVDPTTGKVTAVAAGEVDINATSKEETDKLDKAKIIVNAASQPENQAEPASVHSSFLDFDTTKNYLLGLYTGKTYTVSSVINLASASGNVATAGEIDCTLAIPKTATVYSSDYAKLNTLAMNITATNVTGLKATGDANVNAAVGADGKTVTIKAKNGITEDTKATITLSGTTTGTGKKAMSVTCTVTVLNCNTKLTASDGSELYADTNKTVLTVGNYTGQKVYKAGGDYSYTGWQTINGSTYFYDKNGNKATGEQVIKGAKYNFGSDGALLKSGNGIDVSKWQGNINWSQASSAISFAVIRCGYRGTSGKLAIDPQYLSNIKGAKAAGVKTGIYFYSRATNEAEAIEEASLAVSLAQQGGGVSLPIYMDMESSNQKGLSSAQLTAIANAFISTVNNGGYRGGLYASKSWLASRMENAAGVSGSIWCAQYNTKCTYGGRKDMWQYTSKGTCPGINGAVDWNESYF